MKVNETVRSPALPPTVQPPAQKEAPRSPTDAVVPPRPANVVELVSPERTRVAAAASPAQLWRTALPRPTSEAVARIDAFDARLGLGPLALADRRATMSEDPHAFFRGNPHLFHADRAGAWATQASLLDRPAPQLLVLGDVHLKNFGTVRAPDGATVFAANDFDQAAVGSPEADLQRLAVSVALTARAQGLTESEVASLVTAVAERYADEVQAIASEGAPRRPWLTAEEAPGRIGKRIEKADEVSQEDLLSELTSGGRFLRDDELREPSAADAARIRAALSQHDVAGTDRVEVPLRVLDVVEKLGSGGSSRGLPRHYALVAGADGKPPIVLELKELVPMALDDRGGGRGDAATASERSAALGGAFNPLSGAVTVGGTSLLIREREAVKDDLSGKDLDGFDRLMDAARVTATLTARHHARTPEQAQQLATWIGGDRALLGQALADFAGDYAAQVTADFDAFVGQ